MGAGFAGIFESVHKTIISDYYRWTLPLTAIVYYGFLGLLGGILIGIGFIILALMTGSTLSRKMLFTVSSSAMSVLILIGYFYIYILNSIGLRLETALAVFLAKSIIIMAFYLLLFAFWSSLFYLAERIRFKALYSFILLYLLLVSTSGIIALLSPRHQIREVAPKIENVYVDPGKPNVIFILIDALRYDWISPYGYDIKTPAMQGLREDGILYENAIANSNWTTPSVASIFTSLLPQEHRILSSSKKLPSRLPVLAGEMANAGYYTAGFSTNPNIQPLTNFNQGFKEFYYLKGVEAIPIDPDAPLLRYHFEIRAIIRNILPWLKKKEKVYCFGEPLTDRVIDWLRNNRDRKFFMYIHYMDPHTRYYKHPFDGEYANPKNDPGGDNYELYTGLYKGEIEYTDVHLGRLITFLKENNLYDSSLIVFTADHGEEMFDHYGWEHYSSMFEEQIHIPLIIKLPFSERAGELNSTLVSQIDFAPTILDIAGVSIPESWEGFSFLDEKQIHGCIVSQAVNGRYKIWAVRTLIDKWIETDPGYERARLANIKFAQVDRRAAFPDKNFFDLINDPEEKNNLYEDSNYAARMDTVRGMGWNKMKEAFEASEDEEDAVLDEETKQRLKELGYMQ